MNVTLVLFKKTHEYGYAHREFGRFAEATETQSQVTAAVVVIGWYAKWCSTKE